MNALAMKSPERVSAAQYEAEMAAIVRGHVIKRLTPSEISEETGIPVHRVKDRLNRAGYSFSRPRPVPELNIGSGQDRSLPEPDRDDAYVTALVARGGLPRLSEKLTRLGHVVCMPLVPFEARP